MECLLLLGGAEWRESLPGVEEGASRFSCCSGALSPLLRAAETDELRENCLL
jgi:hypothetical protein